ncbi:MAG: hypothetical protein ACFFCW_34535, partial [Candidatus Hodarchaeota archaeon]
MELANKKESKKARIRRNNDFPITSHQSPVISLQSPVISLQSPVTSYQLSVTSYQLSVSCFLGRVWQGDWGGAFGAGWGCAVVEAEL